METMYRRVDVKERLPENDKFYNCICNYTGMELLQTAIYMSNYKYWTCEHGGIKVTHWLEPITGHFFTDAELDARDKERDKEVAGKSWDAALDNWDWRYDNTNPESPDKETYINQL